jgi:hypothetical protein
MLDGLGHNEVMDALVQFLRSRLDEDAAWATEASRRDEGAPVPGGAHWQWEDGETDEVITPDLSAKGPLDEDVALSLRSRETWPTGSVGELPQFAIHAAEDVPVAVGGHIVRHDPARVLAEVDAKRQVVERFEQAQRYASTAWGQSNAASAEAQALRAVALLLASVHADHPDYRDEWKP